MRVHWKSFIIICGSCGHRNRPSKSPREGIRLALTGQMAPCRGCDKVLQPPRLSARPLVTELREELLAQGITPVC